MSFHGKVALVTGASSGIGRSVAEAFARDDIAVVLTDVNDVGEAVARSIEHAGGHATFIRADVSKASDCELMVATALDVYGRLDYACNNAGIAGDMNSTADYSLEGWNRVIATNLTGVFLGMKYEIPAMLESGGGAIVNVSSILGAVAFANAPAYTAAKHGVVGLTQCTAIEYAAKGIRVNSVGPAFIKTPMIGRLDDDPATHSVLVSLHPIGRLGRPEEVAELVVWLCSDKASFVTGSYYPIDGGYLAR